MLDGFEPSYQRSRGLANASFDRDGNPQTLYQSGSAKVISPQTHGDVAEVVVLNTSGGLTGGDTFEISLSFEGGANVIASTQTAERAYASVGGSAQVSVNLDVGGNATCLWLPQETILFERSALQRKTKVILGDRAKFVGLETLVVGRAAMGEHPKSLELSDVRHVYNAKGELVWGEQLGLNDMHLGDQESLAGLNGHSVVSSLVYLGVDAEDRLSEIRRLLPCDGQFAASAWEGRLLVRALASDSWQVRKGLAPAICALGFGRLPRVWAMQ